MTFPNETRIYERWAPVVGRILLSSAFLVGAAFKIPGTPSFTASVDMVAALGIPLASVGVFLAFVLELVAGVALVIGWKTRLFAFLLMLYVIVLTILFHIHFQDPAAIGMFVSHLYLLGGLLYLSVYGAQSTAVTTCPLPQELTKKGG